jgi:hypothetical protein
MSLQINLALDESRECFDDEQKSRKDQVRARAQNECFLPRALKFTFSPYTKGNAELETCDVLAYRPFAGSCVLVPCRDVPGFKSVVTEPTSRNCVLRYSRDMRLRT